jgi:thiamine pyrophosphate-dependent acetolactate synthase large subunit-like protein
VLSDALREYSAELAAAYDGIALPHVLDADPDRNPLGLSSRSVQFARSDAGEVWTADRLADPPLGIALLAGPGACADVDGVHVLARRLGAPVANTWGAKGIYPWDSPHHMGTCGLQRDDFLLLGFADFAVVLAIGLDEAEARSTLPEGTRLVHFAGRLDHVTVRHAPRRLLPAGDNELYRRLSAIAQPGYVDDSTPRHPARAVMDLKQALGATTRVTAQPGELGLWVARTFPTDRLGSVIVPAHDRPGVAAAVGFVSAARGTETVTVARDPVDETTLALVALAIRHDLPLRLEVWGDDVDWSHTDALLAAAGPVVAWTAGPDRTQEHE